jgi:16S rRNA (uracil1498-N3)-methyltransferase
MAEPRILIEQRLGAGARLDLDEAQTRHLGAVLRLNAGDAVRVFNAEDGEWAARVAEKSKRAMSVRVEDFLRPARAAPDLELLFAPVKRHATDLIVEKATELGARRLRPVITKRTIAETVRADRLTAIAREAAEQTERFDLPEIAAAAPLAQALDGWAQARPLVFADEEGDAPPIAEAARALDRRGGVSLLIGPEGGFTAEERAMLRGLAFVKPVSLGPRILRAETAVIAALSTIQAHWGDWSEA